MSGVFSQCDVITNGQVEIDSDAFLCMIKAMEQSNAEFKEDVKSWLMVLCSALVFFMQAGFAMLCAGCVRKKNLQNTMLKNVLDVCGAAVAFYVVGFAFAFGESEENFTLLGTEGFLSMDVDFSFWFMQFAFSSTCVTIVAGTIAERTQMRAYLLYSLVLCSLVYPVVVHTVWSNNGFLSAASKKPLGGIGAIDFAGSGVIHTTGGTVALVSAWVLGPRRGRFFDAHGNRLSKPKTIPGHSVALQLMGTLVLWFGWYGFNPGSALLLGVENPGAIAARASANTTLAAAAGALASLFFNIYLQYEYTGGCNFDLAMTMNGALSGLVSITAGCGTVELWAAFVTGIVAGFIFVGGHYWLEKLCIDDVVDGIPIHLFNGVWGMVATGLFSSPKPTEAAFGSNDHVGFFYSLGQQSADATLLGNQVLAILFIVSWSTLIMLPFFSFLTQCGWYRLPETEEILGLDHSFHAAVLKEAESEIHKEIKEYNKVQRNLCKRGNTMHSINSASPNSGVPTGIECHRIGDHEERL